MNWSYTVMRPRTSYLNEDELRLVERRCRAPGQPSTCAFCARTIPINAVREVLVDPVRKTVIFPAATGGRLADTWKGETHADSRKGKTLSER